MHVRVARFLLTVLVLTGVTLPAAGCGDTPTAPANYAPFSQTDLRVGSGAELASGQEVTVRYTGWLYDRSKPDQKGLQFDTSLGRDPLEFTVGIGAVIAGWDRGLPGMRVGGIRRLVIPPSLAYGLGRNALIPGNSTLVFEVELLTIVE